MSVLEIAGCGIHYWDAGSGPAIVLTHGAGADHHMFDEQVPYLVGEGYRVITWDLRGHGSSRPAGATITPDRLVEDLLALLVHLGLDRPVLLGQSLGGNLGQEFVRRGHPVAGLVIIGSAWNTEPLGWMSRQLLRTAGPALRLIPASRLPKFMADASAVTPAARHNLERSFSILTTAQFVEVWNATTAFLRADADYRTPVPLLLIRGSDDRTGNIASAMPRWAAAEGVAEHVIAGAGHVANADDPATVNAVLGEWLKRRH